MRQEVFPCIVNHHKFKGGMDRKLARMTKKKLSSKQLKGKNHKTKTKEEVKKRDHDFVPYSKN